MNTFSPEQIAKLREETPGCRHVLHFNNAGAALIPQPVLSTMADYQDLEARIGGYEAAAQEHEKIEGVYQSIARLIQAKPNEIALADSATTAWDRAFYAIPLEKRMIVTSISEYASNYLAFLQVAKRHKAHIKVVPNDEDGQISLEALERLITRYGSRIKVIALTHVPTNGGLINPAEAVGEIARAHGILYLLDACQSVGQMPIDVTKIQCDMLSATGRKYLRGPRGTGFLFIRQSLLQTLEPPMIDLHAATWVSQNAYTFREDARRFETWEKNYANMLGLGAAVDYADQIGLPAIEARVQKLSQLLRNYLQKIPGVTLHDQGLRQCGIVTFTDAGKSPVAIQAALRAQEVNVSVSTQEYARLDMEDRRISQLVRASVHYYNTEAEVERFCQLLFSLS